MSTAEIRLFLLDKIMHMSEQNLLKLKNVFEQVEPTDDMLTPEQRQELLKRTEEDNRGEGTYYPWNEIKKELEKKFA